MTTEKQTAANRANAQKSTGPRERTSIRLNALKHGMLAKQVVIPGEDPSEFAALHDACIREFNPESVLETELVDQMVTAIWRLRRARRVEAGIFASATRTVSITEEETLEYKAYVLTGQASDSSASDLAERQALEALGTVFIDDSRGVNAFSKLSRYEAGIERKFTRALHELQRIQAKREGERVPAPEAVDVTVHTDQSSD